MALKAVTDLFIGSGDCPRIYPGKARKTHLHEGIKHAALLEGLITAFNLNAFQGTSAIPFVLKLGSLGLASRIASISLRFRTDPGTDTSKTNPTIRKVVAGGLDLARLAALSSLTIATEQQVMGRVLPEVCKEFLMGGFELEAGTAAVLGSLAVGIGGLAFAKAFSQHIPQTCFLIRPLALTTALFGLSPKIGVTLADAIYYGVKAISFKNPILVASIFGAAMVSYVDAEATTYRRVD